jgi:hypothetical protein
MLDSLVRVSRRAAYSHYDSILADATPSLFPSYTSSVSRRRSRTTSETGEHHTRSWRTSYLQPPLKTVNSIPKHTSITTLEPAKPKQLLTRERHIFSRRTSHQEPDHEAHLLLHLCSQATLRQQCWPRRAFLRLIILAANTSLCGNFSGTSSLTFRATLKDLEATFLWFVFTLKAKIKGTFALLLY